jgi:HCOMODA/2-hydroxy-3-carboxy-muconic semialdehyde decarboxylase
VTAGTVAATARALCRAGLIEAFGHVSARDGARVWITPTTPLAALREDEVLTVGEHGEHLPLETPLHLAIYEGRPDVTAICRFHGHATVLWGALPAVPPLGHGLGGLSGEVALHEEPLLVSDAARAHAAAMALGGADALLLAANGAVTVGPDLQTALARAWFLEERCRVAWALRDNGSALAGDVARARAADHGAELARANRWVTARFGDEGDA